MQAKQHICAVDGAEHEYIRSDAGCSTVKLTNSLLGIGEGTVNATAITWFKIWHFKVANCFCYCRTWKRFLQVARIHDLGFSCQPWPLYDTRLILFTFMGGISWFSVKYRFLSLDFAAASKGRSSIQRNFLNTALGGKHEVSHQASIEKISLNAATFWCNSKF